MMHQFLTHLFQRLIGLLVVSVVWAPWILGHISFPKPSSPTLDILSIWICTHLLPIHFRVGLLYLFHLKPRALDPESFFLYDPKSYIFHLEPRALDPKLFFIYDPESSLFHVEPRALDLESFFIYDIESFLFHLELRALDLESFFIYDRESYLFHLEPKALNPKSFFIYDPKSSFPNKQSLPHFDV